VGAVGAVLLALIVLFGLLHAVYTRTGQKLFNLDREMTPAAAYSALLLAVAGALYLVAVVRRRIGASSLLLSGLLLLMAGDELLSWHERLEDWTGVDWELLYAPVVLAAAFAWFKLVRDVRDQVATVVMLLVGAGCWGISQVLEALEWDGDVPQPGYHLMVPAEELLEMCGSALFLLAALAIVRRRRPLRTSAGSQVRDTR
jgi:hypothetical protein